MELGMSLAKAGRLWCTHYPDFRNDAFFRKIFRHWCPNRGVRTTIREGFEMVLNPSEYISSEIFFFGVYDETLTAWIKANVTEGWVCWDVGAGFGWISLLLGRIVGHAGVVDAFEAFPQNYQQLLTNIECNGYTWVKPHQTGICDSAGPLWFIPPSDKTGHVRNNSGVGHVVRQVEPGAIAIQTTTLDQYAENNGQQVLDFIKVDIEGCEVFALRGGKKTIERFRPKMVIEYNPHALIRAGTSVEELDDLLERLRYDRFVFSTTMKRLRLAEMIENWNDDTAFNVYCYPRPDSRVAITRG